MDDLVGEKVALGLRDGDDIIGSTRLEKHRVVRACLDCVPIHVHASAELPTVEVGQKTALARPDLNATLLQRQKLFLFVQKDKRLRRREIRRLSSSLVLAVDDFEWIAARLKHDTLVELL